MMISADILLSLICPKYGLSLVSMAQVLPSCVLGLRVLLCFFSQISANCVKRIRFAFCGAFFVNSRYSSCNFLSACASEQGPTVLLILLGFPSALNLLLTYSRHLHLPVAFSSSESSAFLCPGIFSQPPFLKKKSGCRV